MSYQVKFTETTNPAKPSLTVADQSLNSETSLVFPGKNYAGYAPVFAENLLHMLENFEGFLASARKNKAAVQLGNLFYIQDDWFSEIRPADGNYYKFLRRVLPKSI